MNKFIASTSLLGICLLTSCSTINGFRQDPDSWGKKGNTKKVSKTKKTPKKKVVNRSRSVQSNAASNSSNTNRSNPTQGRTVPGFIEPNVTKLPDNKELQESNNVAPAPKLLTPMLESPITPTLPDAPPLADPTAPLPPTQ